MCMYSNGYEVYLKKIKKEKMLVLITQISIIVVALALWELVARLGIVNTFLSSSPSKVLETLINLWKSKNLFNHILVTFYEVLISFLITSVVSLLIASILWWNKFLSNVIDPYLTILNSLPKVALGPIIIIWAGAGMNSIILMSILIAIVISIMNIYTSFKDTDTNRIKLLKSFGASKMQIYSNVIIPSSYSAIINTIKVNISMSLVGVIMGEFLVSKQGIGYLIMYGSQVFNLNLVITGIFILGVLAALMYYFIIFIEKKVVGKF